MGEISEEQKEEAFEVDSSETPQFRQVVKKRFWLLNRPMGSKSEIQRKKLSALNLQLQLRLALQLHIYESPIVKAFIFPRLVLFLGLVIYSI